MTKIYRTKLKTIDLDKGSSDHVEKSHPTYNSNLARKAKFRKKALCFLNKQHCQQNFSKFENNFLSKTW